MGHMKDFDRRIRQGGDDAIAAVAELWESREKILFDITDAFTKARWVPVAERLPGKGEPVLLFCPPEDDEDTWLTYCDIGRYSHTVNGNHWFDTDDGGALPTHWMPLPEPPSP